MGSESVILRRSLGEHLKLFVDRASVEHKKQEKNGLSASPREQETRDSVDWSGGGSSIQG